MSRILGLDVGGTGIKAALVETTTGNLLSDRQRVPTPRPSTPKNVAEAIRQLVSQFDYRGRIGCCFPAVVVKGTAKTAGNIDKSWRNTPVDELLRAATGHRYVVLNDADAAGVAEMRLGAGRGLDGMVITITIGTGLGSGVFYRGTLIPNIELGRMPGKDGKPIEFYAGNRARKQDDLSWSEWGGRFNYFLGRVVRVCSPDYLIIGGGASNKFDKFRDAIDTETPICVARFRNNAGIIGAALAATGKEL